MILLFVFFLAVAYGFLRGGSLANLQFLSLRGYGIVLAAFAIQLVLIYAPLPNIGNNLLRVLLLLVSYVMVAIFLLLNRRVPGMWLFAIGFLANWAVILANGGYMPITYEALASAGLGHAAASAAPGTLVFGSKDVLLPFAETRLGWLSDIFVIPPPFPVPSVFSIGDVFIALGIFWLVPGALGSRMMAPVRTHVTKEANS